MRRELSTIEKNLIIKSMNRLKKELIHLEYLAEYQDLMINKGLYQNYIEKLNEFKNIKTQIMQDITENYRKLNLLQEHLDKGVEIKEDVVPTGVG